MSQLAKNDFLMILNEEGTIVKAEGNTLVPLGIPANKTISMQFSEFVVPEEEILTSEMISQVLMTGQSSTFTSGAVAPSRSRPLTTSPAWGGRPS